MNDELKMKDQPMRDYVTEIDHLKRHNEKLVIELKEKQAELACAYKDVNFTEKHCKDY